MGFGVTTPEGVAPEGEGLQNPYSPKHHGINHIYVVPAFICRQASFLHNGSVLRLCFSSTLKCFRCFRASWNVWDSA